MSVPRRRWDEPKLEIGISKRANTRSKALVVPNRGYASRNPVWDQRSPQTSARYNCRQIYFLGSRTAVQAVNTTWKEDRDAKSRDGRGRMPASGFAIRPVPPLQVSWDSEGRRW